MKKIMSLIFYLALLAPAIPASSAAPSADEKSEDSANPKELLEIGNRRDTSKISHLRRIKAQKEKHKNSPASAAQMALAKMGEKTEMNEILAEAKSDEPDVQSEGIEKLRYVGDKIAVDELRRLLDHPAKHRRKQWKGPDGKPRRGHVIFEPPSYQAVRALQQLFPEGPKPKGKFLSDDDVIAWKDWLNGNKQKYE